MERIELPQADLEAAVLPLYYTEDYFLKPIIPPSFSIFLNTSSRRIGLKCYLLKLVRKFRKYKD